MKKVIEYYELLNTYKDLGLQETARQLVDKFGINEKNIKYEWYISPSELEREILRDKLGDEDNLERVFSKVKTEMSEKGVTLHYSLTDYSLQIGSTLLGTGQKIELKNKDGLIKVVSYKEGVESLINTLVRVMWRLGIE